jgi:hypothetical protein
MFCSKALVERDRDAKKLVVSTVSTVAGTVSVGYKHDTGSPSH